MVSRERILEAAARVYARHGFKGTTTRAIAIEAGVNEVTLFRTFGSKSALVEAVLIRHVSDQPPSSLPSEPTNPHAELKAFIQFNLDRVGEMRPLLIHTMGEVDERADAKEFACRGRHQVHDIITTYISRLQEKGLARADVDIQTAAVMLTGAIMSDVMGRPIVPDVYPPISEVAERYATLFLRAIGVSERIAPEEKPIASSATPNRIARPSSRKSHPPKRTRT
jgi:AcrR family transcriptional regulator